MEEGVESLSDLCSIDAKRKTLLTSIVYARDNEVSASTSLFDENVISNTEIC